jgi:hypothetical protein
VNTFTGHLQVVTVNNYNTIAISTFYSSLEHTVECSQSVTRSFLVTAPKMAIPLHPVQVLSSQTPVQNWLSSNLVPCLLHLGTYRIENTDLPFLRSCPLLQERVYWSVAQKRPWYTLPSRGCCIATGLHASSNLFGFHRLVILSFSNYELIIQH